MRRFLSVWRHNRNLQIAEYAKAIYTYPKWDEVLEVFRQEAFEAKNSNS